VERLEFDWDNANVTHLARHRVLPREAEHVVLHDAIDLGTEIVNGEEREACLGATAKGRVLVVVTTWRSDRLRVVTAFEPSKKLVQLYYLGRAR
jgi:uncharacterized protein